MKPVYHCYSCVKVSCLTHLKLKKWLHVMRDKSFLQLNFIRTLVSTELLHKCFKESDTYSCCRNHSPITVVYMQVSVS